MGVGKRMGGWGEPEKRENGNGALEVMRKNIKHLLFVVVG